MKNYFSKISVLALLMISLSCSENPPAVSDGQSEEETEMHKLVSNYAVVDLTADLSGLSANRKLLIKKLIEASDVMEDLFWKDAIGDKTEFLSHYSDPDTLAYLQINYGPWDRLNGDKDFIGTFGEKSPGANYYPHDITAEEFAAFPDMNKNSWYTLLRRDEHGALKCVWYHEAYADEIERAAVLLEEAAQLAEDEGFKNYLQLRAKALRTDDYLESDLAWMDMKNNVIDIVIGPIESYEDAFKGIKAAHSGQVLVKDLEWTKKIAHYNELLPKLQASLPVDEKYKQEQASTSGDMNVYNVVYYSGDCNAGGKNIAINLPNDPRVHEAKSSRKLQLKNAMQAKFDAILVPIAEILIDSTQLHHVKFEDAFFQNVMFHEVAHGLGVKWTIADKNRSVRDALEKYYSPLEEAKADILGLHVITQLTDMGELGEKDLMDNYVTFLAGIFRSIRFGAADAHGQANMLEFQYLKEKNAFNYNAETGKYSVNLDNMKTAVEQMANAIIVIQGDGNLEAAKQWVETKSTVDADLQKDLDKIAEAGIPKDIVFNQGAKVLGL